MLLLILSCSKPSLPPVINGELQPQFWTSLQHSLACFPDHLYAWNQDDTVGIDVFIAHPFANPDNPKELLIDLADPGNHIMVETGKQISSNFCVDKIKVIPVARVYESISGIITVDVDYNNKQIAAHISNTILQHPSTNHMITIDNVQFPMQKMFPRKSQ